MLHCLHQGSAIHGMTKCDVNRRWTGSGWSLMDQSMQSGLKTWTRYLMTIRSCAWWVEKLFSSRQQRTWSLNRWT